PGRPPRDPESRSVTDKTPRDPCGKAPGWPADRPACARRSTPRPAGRWARPAPVPAGQAAATERNAVRRSAKQSSLALFVHGIEQELANQVFQHQRRLGVADFSALAQHLLVAADADADVLLTQQAGGEDRRGGVG